MLKRLWVLLFIVILLPLKADAGRGVMLTHHISVQKGLGLSNYKRKKPIGIVIMDNGFGSEADIKEEFPEIAEDKENRILFPDLLGTFINAGTRHGLDGAIVLRSEINGYEGPDEGDGLQFYFSNDTHYTNAEAINNTTNWIEKINKGKKGPDQLIKIVVTTITQEWGFNDDTKRMHGIIANAWSDMVARTGVIIIASAGNYGWRVWDGNIVTNPDDPKQITFDGESCLKLRNHPQNAVATFIINWNKNPDEYDTGTDFDLDAELFEIKGIRRTLIAQSKKRQKANLERNKDKVITNLSPETEDALAVEIIDRPLVKESKANPNPERAPVGIKATPVAAAPAPAAAGGAAAAPKVVIPKPDRNRAPSDGSTAPVEAPKAERPPKLKLDEETDYELCVNIFKGDFRPNDHIRITVLNEQETPSYDPVEKKITWPTEIIAPKERLKNARSIFNPSSAVIYVGAGVPYSGSDPELKLPQIMMPAWTASVTLNDRKILSGVTTSTWLFTAIVARMFDYRPTLDMDFLLSWNSMRNTTFGIEEVNLDDFKKYYPTVWSKIVASLGRGRQPTLVGGYKDKTGNWTRYVVGVNVPPENLPDPNDRNRPLFENLPTKELFGPDYQFFLTEKGERVRRDVTYRTRDGIVRQRDTEIIASGYAVLSPAEGEAKLLEKIDPFNDIEVIETRLTELCPWTRPWATPTTFQTQKWQAPRAEPVSFN